MSDTNILLKQIDNDADVPITEIVIEQFNRRNTSIVVGEDYLLFKT